GYYISKHPSHAVRPEPAAVIGEEIVREVVEIRPEPASERYAEAGLAARGDLGRKIGGKRTTQRHLSLPAACLEGVGERKTESDDLVIEKRRAQLQRVGHRREIRFRQQVAGQVRLDVEQLQARDAGSRGLEWCLSSQSSVGPELAPQLDREDLHQACVPPLAGCRRSVEEARATERERSRVTSGHR